MSISHKDVFMSKENATQVLSFKTPEKLVGKKVKLVLHWNAAAKRLEYDMCYGKKAYDATSGKNKLEVDHSNAPKTLKFTIKNLPVIRPTCVLFPNYFVTDIKLEVIEVEEG